eukprot:sb/3463897/
MKGWNESEPFNKICGKPDSTSPTLEVSWYKILDKSRICGSDMIYPEFPDIPVGHPDLPGKMASPKDPGKSGSDCSRAVPFVVPYHNPAHLITLLALGLTLNNTSPRELSEVDRYSQSLDKCRFVDAKDRLGPETEQFANFLKALRDNASLIAIIFLTDSHTRGNAQERRYAEKYPQYKDLMTIRGKVEGYRKRIAEHVVAMVTQIRRHLHSFPPYLRWLGCCMAEFLRQYQGCNQDQINFVLGEFFYTRMLFFPFIQPTNFAQTKSEVSDLAKSNLKMVTLAFREVFLMQLGFLTYEKCSFTSVFQYIGDYKCHIITLLEEIVDVPYSSSVLQTDDVPLHRSALMIPERHLKKLINTLMEFLASGRFQPDEKEMLATALAQLPSEPTRYLRDRPARPERPPAPGSDKGQKKNKPELPNPTAEEEILVFSLPATHGDKLKSQTEVLGKNLDSTNDGSIIDRVLEPSLGDPLSVQEDMKGSKFHLQTICQTALDCMTVFCVRRAATVNKSLGPVLRE